MSTPTQYALKPWRLNDLFSGMDSPDIQAVLAEVEEKTSAFEVRRGELRDDISTEAFFTFVKQVEEITYLIHKLYGFAGLSFAQNTQDQQASAFQSRVMQLYAQVQNRTLFFNLWWKQVPDERAEALMASAGHYRYWLQEMRNMKPYTLTEPEEKIINLKNVTGIHALNVLYNTITNRYTYDIEVDGEMHTGLSRDGLMQFVTHHDPDVRARAYQILYAKYGEEAPILGQIYQNIVTDWRNENVEVRSFPSPISVRNLHNDVPDAVVDTLLEVASHNTGLFQRYFKLKASWLGMDKLRRYDIYAPVAKSDKEFAFDEAVQLTLEAFRRFDPQIANFTQKVLEDDHVDSELRAGKTGGAFCWDVVPDLTPWVLLNYAGKARDVSTLAHEMGHAIHAMLASHLPVLTASASLPLAETASTFGEMLLVDYLLEREDDDAVRRDLLFRQMDDAYATIMRQSFFALFEKEAHSMIAENASVDDLAEAYYRNLETQFGDALELSEEFKWEWVSIPHIYGTPFYVYAYAFGQLLVLALYRQYQTEGDSFKPRYLEILSAGGSASPTEILARAGIDVSQASFWQGGFDLLEEMLSRLEAMPIE